MTSFLYDLKGQATIFNALVLLLLTAYFFNRYHKRRVAIALVSISLSIFLLCSTSYLPNYLADKIEREYPPFLLPVDNTDTVKTLIHVLGSGYTLDKRLPANAQIGMVALGRLAEGIRIHRAIKNSVIICSGFSPVGLETQAQVTKRAAINLGVGANELETLNKPRTTLEEAKELGKRYDKSSKLIVVTDALHMSRAMKIFKTEGFHPIAAPTNYKIKEASEDNSMKWWPSFGNIWLMNYLIHEYLGNLKAAISR
ncbi:MAG: YcdF like superfamily protein [Ferruginibacter sp.]|nr:YcdF like superfamily protein [Ferruginibacter sp.]